MSDRFFPALTIDHVTLSLPSAASIGAKSPWQSRLQTALARVAIAPTLPPQSILIVRHLPDPNPGQLLAEGGWQQWERAAENSLLHCWRTAANPARQSVPSSTNSVWFADRAEWLACLSWDIALGVAHDRWWWQTALRSYAKANPSDSLTRLWLAESQGLPAAIALLWQREQAGISNLVTSLATVQHQQIINQLALTFDFPSLVSNRQVLPILIPLIPLSARSLLATLSPESQVLIALCLTLPQSLPLLRSPIAFNSPNPWTFDADPASADPALEAQPKTTEDLTSARDNILERPSQGDRPLPTLDFPNFKTSPSDRLPSSPRADSPTPITLPEIITSTEQEPSPTIAYPPEIPTQSQSIPELGIFTQIGGLWYLVNALVALDWLATLPPLNPWRQLIAIAQALLPDIPPDPIWGILTELAGESLAPASSQQWQTEAIAPVRAYLENCLEDPDAIADYLLEPATLYLTRTHVDLIFSLDRVRLDIRQAGLDRDPGWVPELARAIAFHYE